MVSDGVFLSLDVPLLPFTVLDSEGLTGRLGGLFEGFI